MAGARKTQPFDMPAGVFAVMEVVANIEADHNPHRATDVVNTEGVDIGLSVASEIPGLDGAALVDAIIERAEAAREAGLASLHVGDMHGVATPYAANLALAGRLAGVWPRRLGVLTISSMWNPVLLAEQLATLAAMCSEFDVVMALGHGEDQFAGVGVPVDERLTMFVAGFKMTRALLEGEVVTATVGPYQIRDAKVTLGGTATISWLIAANAPMAIRRAAAQLGAGWLASAKLTPTDAAKALEAYRNAGGTGRAILRRDVFIGASQAEVEKLADPVIAAGHRGYPADAIIRGTADQVEEEISQFAGLGFDELLARSLVPAQAPALDSIARLGRIA